jgi:CHAT domain-containing protein/cytochrome c-type biogenesis protein CcmH/NrfG
VPRPPDQHLNDEELERLLSENRSRTLIPGVREIDPDPVRAHLSSCEACSELMRIQSAGARHLLQLKMKPHDLRTANCPPDEDWIALAAGTLADDKLEERLEHATHCGHCGQLLKVAAEVFAEDRTREEDELLAKLRSSEPAWQKKLSAQIHSAVMAASLPKRDPTRQKGKKTRWVLTLTTSFAALLILLVAVRWLVRQGSQKDAASLLAQAYTDERTMEPRIPGATHAPIRSLRGSDSSHLSHPASLLEAESLIANRLRSSPDDLSWLRLKGRADLLDNNYDSALSTLERAHRYSPEDSQITIDLASAYLLRGDQSSQAADYGQSVELLGQVLQKNPQDQTALFNRAIALERLFLYGQAENDWRTYLKLDTTSGWAEEARARLAALEEKIRQQKDRSGGPLLNPDQFVSVVGSGNTASLLEIDDRVESYVNVALEDWLPDTASNRSSSDTRSDSAGRALQNLSELLVSRHSDPWLRDFLNEIAAHPDDWLGVSALARSLRVDPTSDAIGARESALRAAAIFRRNKSKAGELRALFEITYADQLSRESKRCKAEAEHEQTANYPWLQAQMLLELAACSDLSDERSRNLASEAMKLAKQHHYNSIDLRAITFLAGLYQSMGDPQLSWKNSYAGLGRYWTGVFPPMRGYSLYAGLDLLAEDNQQWYLDVSLIQEALTLIQTDPDLALRAFEQHRLARAQLVTGNLSGAEMSFHQAEELFFRTPAGDRKENLEVEAQLGLASIETMRAQPDKAIARLERIRAQINQIPDNNLTFEFFKNLGLAYMKANDSYRAEQCLAAALRLSEVALRSNTGERERLIWSRKTDPVYRAMTRIRLAVSPREGLAAWEWYKGASLRSSQPALSLEALPQTLDPELGSASDALPADTTLIVYAFFDDGLAVWTYNREGVTQQWIQLHGDELNTVAISFAGHCSRPDSDVVKLRSEARILYHTLLDPIEAVISSHPHLIIEPDRELWFVPFEVLVDQKGEYLEDRRTLSYSSGLAYLNRSPRWPGVSYQNRALVIGESSPGGDWKQLPEVEAEAKGIAGRFRYSRLLLGPEVNSADIAHEFGKIDVFHFSGHATALTDHPGLVLGTSSVLEISSFKGSGFLTPRLVVLSACSTANGTSGAFEDQDSLARLLFGSGVPEVVASRWMVDSHATSEIMNDFYTGLFSGQSVSGSLQTAVRNLKAQNEYSHPFYWAGFAAFGKN